MPYRDAGAIQHGELNVNKALMLEDFNKGRTMAGVDHTHGTWFELGGSELCACACGLMALGAGLVTVERARESAETMDDTLTETLFQGLADRYGSENGVRDVIYLNDGYDTDGEYKGGEPATADEIAAWLAGKGE